MSAKQKEAKKKKRYRRREGDIVQIPLGRGLYTYGRMLDSPLMAFYNLRTRKTPDLQKIVSAPIIFKVWVREQDAVKEGRWKIIGNLPLESSLLDRPWFFRVDTINNKVEKYRHGSGKFTRATIEECEGLESATVWDAQYHVEPRLKDHFAGRPNPSVERDKGELRNALPSK